MAETLGKRVWFGELTEEDKKLTRNELVEAGLEFYKKDEEFVKAPEGEKSWFLTYTRNGIAQYVSHVLSN